MHNSMFSAHFHMHPHKGTLVREEDPMAHPSPAHSCARDFMHAPFCKLYLRLYAPVLGDGRSKPSDVDIFTDALMRVLKRRESTLANAATPAPGVRMDTPAHSAAGAQAAAYASDMCSPPAATPLTARSPMYVHVLSEYISMQLALNCYILH